MWLLFAILAPFSWGLANPIDSALRRSWIKNDLVLTCALAISKLPVAIVLLLLFARNLTIGWPVLGMFLAGVLWTLPFILYYKSLEREETSRVVLIIQFQPVFVFMMAALLINETLILPQLVAFVLILSGSILAAVKKTESKWHFSKVFLFMFLAAVMWSLADVMFKMYAVYFPDFWSAFAVDIFGSSFPALALFLFPKYRKIAGGLKELSASGWKFFVSSAILGTLGSLSFAYALTLGKASLVSVISGFQPIFALFFGMFLARFLKEIPRESLSRSDLLIKAASFVLILSGLGYLYL